MATKEQASMSSYRQLLPQAACVGVLCVGAAFARHSLFGLLEEVLGLAAALLHFNSSMEACFAAAGGILLFACGGPLASYSYVIQYLLQGTPAGKATPVVKGVLTPTSAPAAVPKPAAYTYWTVPTFPSISLESWMGQLLTLLLPRHHVATLRREHRRRLLTGHALACNVSSHRVRHSFEDLPSCGTQSQAQREHTGPRRPHSGLTHWAYAQPSATVPHVRQPHRSRATALREDAQNGAAPKRGSKTMERPENRRGERREGKTAQGKVGGTPQMERRKSTAEIRPRGGMEESAVHRRGASLDTDAQGNQNRQPPRLQAFPLQLDDMDEDDGAPIMPVAHAADAVKDAAKDVLPTASAPFSWANLLLDGGKRAAVEQAATAASAPSSVGSVSYEDARDVFLEDDPVANTALACLGRDTGCPPRVQEAVPEAYLLQFGSLLGEEPCTQALKDRGLAGPWGSRDSVFGVPDTDRCELSGWELIIEEKSETLSYWAWRRPLRAGLYMYRTHTVVEGMSAADVRTFQLDDRARFLWDDTALEAMELPTPGKAGGDSEMAYYSARWPRPMSNREYVYSRRVWDRTLDGGCYCVSVGCDHPDAPHQSRNVRISDYISCLLIRDARSALGYPEGAAELISVYFEDPSTRPGFMNLAIRKGLWGFINRFEASLRVYCRARSGASSASLSRSASRQTLAEGGDAAGGLDTVGVTGSEDQWARLTARMHSGARSSGEKRRFRMSQWVRRGGVIRRRLLWLVATVALYKI